MAEIAISDEYLFIFERVLLALYYFFPCKAIFLLFLFAFTTFFFYVNFQRRLPSCYTDLDCGLGLLFLLERNVSVAFILLLCYCTDEIFFLIYFGAIFVPVNFLYIFHEKNRWMVVACIDIIRKKMNQLAAIVSTEASLSDKKSTEEISPEPGVGDPEIASATDQRSEKKIIGESVDAKLEVGSSKDSAFSKKHSTERNNNRSDGASAHRVRRQSKKKNIAGDVEASSENASPCDKGEDLPQIVEQKTEDDPSNDDNTERTSSETGIVGFSTTGSDQLLKTSLSQFLEEERIKWEEEREKLQAHLDFTSKLLTLTSQNGHEIHAKHLEEKQKWETEKRELTKKLEDSASTSRLLAFYKGKCQSLQLEKNLAAAYQIRSKEKPVLNPEMLRFSNWKSHCKAMEDYLIELDDGNAREKRDLLEKIEEREILVQQYKRLNNDLRKEKLSADAALEMANTALADSRKRILELERHCRFYADQYCGWDGESSEYCPSHYSG